MTVKEVVSFIQKQRKYSLYLLVISVIASIVYGLIFPLSKISIFDYWYTVMISFILMLAVILGIVWVFTVHCLKLLHYEYDGIKIDGYAGYSHHYLFVNGKLVDEYVTDFTFTDINLESNCLGYDIKLTVSPSNSLKLKVNGELVQPKR